MPPYSIFCAGGFLIYPMQSIRFAAKFEFLDEIREFVGGIARSGGFGDKDV